MRAVSRSGSGREDKEFGLENTNCLVVYGAHFGGGQFKKLRFKHKPKRS